MSNSVKYFDAVRYAYDLAIKQENIVGYRNTAGASSVKHAIKKWDIKEPVYNEITDWKKVLYQIKLDLLMNIDISKLSDMPSAAASEQGILLNLSNYIENENLSDEILSKIRLENHLEYYTLLKTLGLKEETKWSK